jgi:sirohydrochlorin ferrochelatase
VKTGLIIIDHGSRNEHSNHLLEAVAQRFALRFAQFDIIEPAHMELAEPSLRDAYLKCVARGATDVVVCPFFLAPGKHMTFDIPRLAEEAAAEFPGTTFTVAAPLGVDELILELLAKRANEAISNRMTQPRTRGGRVVHS